MEWRNVPEYGGNNDALSPEDHVSSPVGFARGTVKRRRRVVASFSPHERMPAACSWRSCRGSCIRPDLAMKKFTREAAVLSYFTMTNEYATTHGSQTERLRCVCVCALALSFFNPASWNDAAHAWTSHAISPLCSDEEH